jgi:hypothetical protein
VKFPGATIVNWNASGKKEGETGRRGDYASGTPESEELKRRNSETEMKDWGTRRLGEGEKKETRNGETKRKD